MLAWCDTRHEFQGGIHETTGDVAGERVGGSGGGFDADAGSGAERSGWAGWDEGCGSGHGEPAGGVEAEEPDAGVAPLDVHVRSDVGLVEP